MNKYTSAIIDLSKLAPCQCCRSRTGLSHTYHGTTSTHIIRCANCAGRHGTTAYGQSASEVLEYWQNVAKGLWS